jgi:hypothetical protein
MTKYRKKPIVVEAFKLGERPYPKWFDEAWDNGVVEWVWDSGRSALIIDTLEGDVRAYDNSHYIIKGVEGEIYPCRVDIFEATYELVED